MKCAELVMDAVERLVERAPTAPWHCVFSEYISVTFVQAERMLLHSAGMG